MKLFSSILCWEIAAIILVAVSFGLDRHSDPRDWSYFRAAERGLSNGYISANIFPTSPQAYTVNHKAEEKDMDVPVRLFAVATPAKRIFASDPVPTQPTPAPVEMASETEPVMFGYAAATKKAPKPAKPQDPVLFAYSAQTY